MGLLWLSASCWRKKKRKKKTFLSHCSNWPTFPQLYVKGELVGGCDIVISMFENGELNTLLVSNKIISDDGSAGKGKDK